MVMQIYNPNSQEAEARLPWIQDQPGLHLVIPYLSQEKQKGNSDNHIACVFLLVFHIAPIQQKIQDFCLDVPIFFMVLT